jgi:hypothetical protein
MPHLEATGVSRTPLRGDLEHVGIDVDEFDPDGRESVEDRDRETSGSGSEIDDEASDRDMAVEPMHNGYEHAVVVRNELADRLVVVVRVNSEVSRDPVLLRHWPTISPLWLDSKPLHGFVSYGELTNSSTVSGGATATRRGRSPFDYAVLFAPIPVVSA